MHKKLFVLLCVGSLLYADTHLDMDITHQAAGERYTERIIQATIPDGKWVVIFEEDEMKITAKTAPYEKGIILSMDVEVKDEEGNYQCLSEPVLRIPWNSKSAISFSAEQLQESVDISVVVSKIE